MDGFAGPLTRILLRYFGAALITKAGLSVDVTDPDVQTVAVFVVGAACAAGSELWYKFARKNGWGR